MPELDTRSLLDSGDLGDEHTLLCPECEDPQTRQERPRGLLDD